MGVFTYFLRDLEQILFPNRDQHPIPAMDGGYTPNDRLDALSPIGAPIPGVDDVAEGGDSAIYVSAGKQVLRLAGAGYEERSVFAEFDGVAGGLAFHPDGRLLVCIGGRGLAAIEAGGRQTWLNQVEDQPLRCLTGVAAAADGSIFMTDGSSRHEREDWVRDLMEKNHLGRLVACNARLDGAKTLLRDLSYPHGVAIAADGKTLWFTESWKHQIRSAALSGRDIAAPKTIVGNMPGYPTRLGYSATGGFWLSVFAVRTHLVEFVLREDDFRQEMMETIPPGIWISPALATSGHCHEPMQFGSIKALGIEKPWAPPRSYGLLVRIDEEGDAAESLHSRVGGQHHGITAARDTAQGLVIVSKGRGCVLLDRSGGRV